MRIGAFVNERFGPSLQGIRKDMPYSDSPLAVHTRLGRVAAVKALDFTVDI